MIGIGLEIMEMTVGAPVKWVVEGEIDVRD